MKTIILLYTSLFLCKGIAFCQPNTSGKVYVDHKLEYLEILNDSTLWTSIGEEQDTARYYISENTLFIRNKYFRSRKNQDTERIINWDGFKLLKKTEDTIVLLNLYKGLSKPFLWDDTLVFVSLSSLKETIEKFRYLKVDNLNPLEGSMKVEIDSTGKVTYYKKLQFSGDGKRETRIGATLSKDEFTTFIETLSYSLPSRLRKRRPCGIDGSTVEFEIAYNGKIVVSKGCELKWVHALLFNYLYDINTNKGLVSIKNN